MGESTSTVMFFLITMAILLLGPDTFIYGTNYIKANEISKDAVSLAEKEGGFTPSVQTDINEKMDKLGLDPAEWKVTYSVNGKVNFNDKFSVKVEGSHTYKAFNLMGTGTGHFKAPIAVEKTGYGEVYYRN